jgi:type I restriction-modification system DNA methylase subunit
MILEAINSILGIGESYQAPERIMTILSGDKAERVRIFHALLDRFDCDMSYDWFHEYFEDEHADRKNRKQDFTPNSISRLISELLGGDTGITYEPAAGTGGMLIVNWHRHRSKTSLFDYRPNDHLVACHELSDRAVPFLLLNLAIRGISGIVFHGDTLRTGCKAVYVLTNEYNSPTDFSTVTKLNKKS